MSNSINQQMTALANAVRNKANIQSKLTITNMITILNGLNLSSDDIVLGEVNKNGDFQPLSFSGSETSISGQPISISSYYTWNNISSTPTPTIEYLTTDYTGRLNVQLTYNNNVVVNNTLTKYNESYADWLASSNNGYNGCFCSSNGCCQDFLIRLPKENQDGEIICDSDAGSCEGLKILKGTQIPLNIELMGLDNIILEATDTDVISVIITKLD